MKKGICVVFIKQEMLAVQAYAKSLLQPGIDTLKQLTTDGFKKLVITGASSAVLLFVRDHLAGFMVLTTFVVIDQLLGVIAAFTQKKFSSHRFRAGAFKVFVYAALITAFHLFGMVNDTIESIKLDNLCILYLAATEALSIIENAQIITGITLPSWVRKLIDIVKRP